MERSYRQSCAAARALDVLGDRWTLLIVRDLMVGPQRYSDFVERLPGIGTNLLAARLKGLVAGGWVERRRIGRPSSQPYLLTAAGWDLEPLVLELVRWGLRHAPVGGDDEHYLPSWSVVTMRALFAPAWARGVDVALQFRVADEAFWARVSEGKLITGSGEKEERDAVSAVVYADEVTYRRFESGESPEALGETGNWVVEGAAEAVEAFRRCFAPPRRAIGTGGTS